MVRARQRKTPETLFEGATGATGGEREEPTSSRPSVSRGQANEEGPGSGSDRIADRPAERRAARRATSYGSLPVQGFEHKLASGEAVWCGFPELERVSEPASGAYSLTLGLTRPQENPPPPDRRRLPRHKGIILSNEERSTARERLRQASACGSSFVAFVRVVEGNGGALEQRIVTRTRCGARQCEECDEERRAREAKRVAGAYNSFLTVGIPAGSVGIGEAWENIGIWTSKLLHEIRRAVDRGQSSRVRFCGHGGKKSHRGCRNGCEASTWGADLEYAWALEPHVSGWPHLHLITTATGISSAWVKTIWSRIIGASVRWCVVKPVSQNDGVCAYLCKYISKARLTLDILAKLGKRRLWASTQKDEKPDAAGWEQVKGMSQDELRRETISGGWLQERVSWKSISFKPDDFVLSERVWTPDDWRWEKLRRFSNLPMIGECDQEDPVPEGECFRPPDTELHRKLLLLLEARGAAAIRLAHLRDGEPLGTVGDGLKRGQESRDVGVGGVDVETVRRQD